MKFTAKHPLILASQSPRRKELLGLLGIPFEIVPSDIPEPNPQDFQSAVDYVHACAVQKAKDIAGKHPEALVIGSDTVVVLNGEILLKPKHQQQASEYLRKLSGNTHEVVTAVCVRQGEEEVSFHESVRVRFYELPASWIDAYTDTEDPYDKAGAYGIQTVSGLFVEGIEGDYNAVVGLPVAKLLQHLMRAGYVKVEGAHDYAQ
ncbi:Maf family protein [Planococcus sp. CP5-4]|uniref:Maf family protein n=1 Tax=unclassified Planococcus (in: firmicutes) TaxID=2662419 RepID=UPI001C21CCB4|nr:MULTISPECIES: nucleoside triphosphate pyrophosphatase [unclassified Planococcus (in: firmicutes)]MBU9672894.1 Maf family protein [Planococcus sp. CP5-4_YE]MBV0908666.1 Maf family protein [Planococcus sp. CP5-4_UN]MBW6063435.1 Maf family protein [Planococcus sp. CP5-4]